MLSFDDVPVSGANAAKSATAVPTAAGGMDFSPSQVAAATVANANINVTIAPEAGVTGLEQITLTDKRISVDDKPPLSFPFVFYRLNNL